MKNKIIISTLIVLLFILSSYSLATNNMMNSTRNAVSNAGNTITSAATTTMNAIGNGVKSVTNGISNADGDVENDATNTMAGDSMFGTTDSNYTATRTATGDNGVLGMSTTTWTWLILGIVGLAIVALVWYYGAQYEHRNYNND